MSKTINDIPKTNYSDFLDELLSHYVDKQGLGGIPKPDLDALIVYLYTKYSHNNEFDAFELAQRFMLKESRIKSLYETGLIKYAGLTEGKAWIDILRKLAKSKFELESNEKAQIRFKFENPALYKYFQKSVRVIGGTAPYSRSYEVITISLSTFFELLEHIYETSQTQFPTEEMAPIHELIPAVIEQLGKSLGTKKLKQLNNESGLRTQAGKALSTASKLTSIGKFVASLLA